MSGPAAWDHECDLLVLGGGGGGLSAALFGALKHLNVLLCEKSPQLGGTTSTSGGIIWVPGSAQARQANADDSIDRARTYLRHEIGELAREDLIEAFLASGHDALAKLEAETEVKFDLIPWPDYHPNSPGAVEKGRSLLIQPFDGRRLGADFALVRPPIQRLMVLGGLMLGADEIPDFLRPFASVVAFRTVVRKLGRYALDRLRYPRGTDIRNGNALVARLFCSLRQRNVPVWTDAPLVELIRQGDRTVGAVINRHGKPTRVRATRGVILATGGFPWSADLRSEFSTGFPHRYSLAFEGDTGDGIAAARAVGAVVDTALTSPALWTPASVIREPDGQETAVIYGYLDRGRPGVIAVDKSGRRFVNESDSYHDIVMAMHRLANGHEAVAHFICDRAFLRKHGLGAIRPPGRDFRRYVKSRYIECADTIADLARRIGADPSILDETVRRHNSFADSGVDLDFGKGSNIYNRLFGEAHGGLNPNLKRIETPPFFALRIRAASLGTTIGLKTDADARVCDADNNPVPGLYACGNEMASAMRGYYPGGGVTLGPAIVFGYRAVEHLTGGSNA